MLSWEEARRRSIEAARGRTLDAEEVDLEAAAGRILAEDALADRDQPPFRRSTRDGFAVRAADGTASRRRVGEVVAGGWFAGTVGVGECVEIMTGAPVPEGAGAIEVIEQVVVDGDVVQVPGGTKPGQHIARRGEDLRAGQVVLPRGQVIRAPEIALLATAGCVRPPVWRRPSCAVISTGDELVEPPAKPGPGQIRESNSRSVQAQFRALGLSCAALGVARDAQGELERRLAAGLERDVLVVSGGVSAGDRDLVIPALTALGVESVMHQVLLRPGRPFFFGRRGERRVFALPGNPVSTFVTFELFVRPFVLRMMGHADGRRPRVAGTLAAALPKSLDRIQMLPAVIGPDGRVQILEWHGSGDQVTLTKANCLAIQPLKTPMAAGDRIEVLPL